MRRLSCYFRNQRNERLVPKLVVSKVRDLMREKRKTCNEIAPRGVKDGNTEASARGLVLNAILAETTVTG